MVLMNFNARRAQGRELPKGKVPRSSSRHLLLAMLSVVLRLSAVLAVGREGPD